MLLYKNITQVNRCTLGSSSDASNHFEANVRRGTDSRKGCVLDGVCAKAPRKLLKVERSKIDEDCLEE
jgi:hypothetical protein